MTLATAATAAQPAIDGQSATLARSALVMSESNDPEKPQQVVDGKEVLDGEVHYLVEWSATLVPKNELGKAKPLVEKFEARFRAQCRQRGGKRRGRLPPSKAGKQAISGARVTGETQQKGRGRPRKQV
jgi:hypothetical protein